MTEDSRCMNKRKRNISLLFFLIVIGACLHFYNLNWGAPFYFHPDERNIASAVSQLQFPNQMNPRFFAYGSLPIYAIYFTSVATNYVLQWLQLNQPTQPQTVPFGQAIIVGRTFSAFFATLLIPILFLLGRKLKNETTGLLGAFLATTSIGFTQFSHYGTFEMWLTFFGVLLFWICLSYFHKPKTQTIIFASITFGILVAIKVTSLALFPIPLALFVMHSIRSTRQTSSLSFPHHLDIRRSDLQGFFKFLKYTLLFIIISVIVYVLTNPFVFLDQKDFLSSMNYESGVALGTMPVFYTGTFFNTIPLVYQLFHVYPFLINPLLTILFIPALVYLFYLTIKQKNAPKLLFIVFFVILLVSQAFLFVKWTRYMMPTLPFIYLSIAITTNSFSFGKKQKKLVVSACGIICLIFVFSYFKTAFINPDTRIAALTFAQHTIPLDAPILSEPADLGIVPFQDAFPHLDSFEFYDLDNNSMDATETELQQKISDAQYIVLPSQRILQSRMLNPTRFPKGYIFYKSLLNGTLGFHKIYETPCDIFCKITYLDDPVYWWEQTTSVFDRPTVFIFKKNS
jgi:hypothetical protein